MKAKIGILSAVVVALALCLVPVAVAQTSVSVSFDGTYSAVSCIGPEGCVGAGLYGGTINGVNVGAGQAVPGMICDDYFDNITAGQTWNANGVSAASLNASNIGSLTMFGASIGVAGYTEVAYLANLMLTSSGLTSTQQGAISEAIWFITSGGKSGALGSTALGYLNAALAGYKPARFRLASLRICSFTCQIHLARASRKKCGVLFRCRRVVRLWLIFSLPACAASGPSSCDLGAKLAACDPPYRNRPSPRTQEQRRAEPGTPSFFVCTSARFLAEGSARFWADQRSVMAAALNFCSLWRASPMNRKIAAKAIRK